jgi:hypothetical protein
MGEMETEVSFTVGGGAVEIVTGTALLILVSPLSVALTKIVVVPGRPPAVKVTLLPVYTFIAPRPLVRLQT